MPGIVSTAIVSNGRIPGKETYKIASISSRVRPLVSGRKKNDHKVASIIHEAKKNQVPYPKRLKM